MSTCSVDYGRANEVLLCRNALLSLCGIGRELAIKRTYFANNCTDTPTKQSLLSWLPEAPPAPATEAMEVDSATAAAPAPKPPAGPEPVPEVDMYLRLLLMHHFEASPSTHTKAIDLAHQTVEKMQALNRRSMDPIAAKVWYALERAYELGSELADARPYVSIS